MSLVISSVVYLLLGTIINMLLKGSAKIAIGIFDILKTAFNSSNVLKGVLDLIPFNFDFFGLILALTEGYLLLSLCIGVIKSLFSPITGDKAENPIQILFNTIVAGLLIACFFGISFMSSQFTANDGIYDYSSSISGGILGTISNLFSLFIKSVFPKAISATTQVSNGGSLGNTIASITDPADYIGILILSAGILGSVVSGAIAILERAIQLGMFVLMGPLCLAMYSNQTTRKNATAWITGIISQLAAIGISVMMWGISMSSLYDFLTGLDISNFGKSIGTAALTIVFFSITGNSEELLNAIGIKTMSPMDSARMVGAGLSDMLRASNIVSSVGKNIASAPGDLQKAHDNLKSGKGLLGMASNLAKNYRTTGNIGQSLHDNNKFANTLGNLVDNVSKQFSDGKATLNGQGKTAVEATGKALTNAMKTKQPTVSYTGHSGGHKATSGLEMAKTQETFNQLKADTGSSENAARVAKLDKSGISKYIPGVACDVGITDPKSGKTTHVSGVLCGQEYQDKDGGWHVRPSIKLPDGFDANQISSINGKEIGGYVSTDLSSIGKDGGKEFGNSMGIFTNAGAAQMVFEGVNGQLQDSDKIKIATSNGEGAYKGDFKLSQATLTNLVNSHPAPEPKEQKVEAPQVQNTSAKASKNKAK